MATSLQASVQNIHIPLDIIDEIFCNLDDLNVDDYRNLCLVNKYFLHVAHKHFQARFFDTQRFTTATRLRDYMSFVREYPESTIPGHITTLEMKFRCQDDPISYEDAAFTIFSWNYHFPALQHFILYLDMDPGYGDNPVVVVNAMQHLIESTSMLQKLSLHFVKLPGNFFSNIGPSLKTLKLHCVQPLEWSLSFPTGLECLVLDHIHDWNYAYAESCRNPEVFSSVRELSICDSQSYESQLWRTSWGLIYNLKNSLKRLEVAPGGTIDYPLYPLDMLALPKLETLTVSMVHGAKASSYIPWLSTVFVSLNTILQRRPRFTLRVLVEDGQDNLAEFDEWINDFFPPKMSLEVIVRILWDDTEEYKVHLSNCDNRGILRVQYETY